MFHPKTRTQEEVEEENPNPERGDYDLLPFLQFLSDIEEIP